MRSNGGEDSEKLKVLFLIIDDEKYIVDTLKDLFEDEYDVLTSTSSIEGLELFKKHHPPLILADQRMPGMTGVELLERIRKMNGDTIRMIITGYSDIQAVIDGVNKGEIFRYITKPWDNEQLKVLIKEGAESYRINMENKRLTDVIKRQRDELEVRVNERTKELEEKTKELEAKIRELEEWAKLTTGREIRMIELKKEVNGLLRELGRPEKYEVE